VPAEPVKVPVDLPRPMFDSAGAMTAGAAAELRHREAAAAAAGQYVRAQYLRDTLAALGPGRQLTTEDCVAPAGDPAAV
jgi:hypothetical protein